MNGIQALKQKFYNYFFNKELKKTRNLRLSTNLEEAHTIGILFNASDESQKRVILQYVDTLKKQGKKVELLGFYNTKKEIEPEGFPFFNRKNIDWFNRPNGETVEAFMKKPFDLLFNLSGTTTPPFDYIMGLSKASFRVGPSADNTACCDLMIDTRNPDDVSNFIKQAEFFLNKMATQHEFIPA